MRYITIEREYGSGGTKIARALAARCEIPCYGQEILEKASEKLGVPPEEIRNYEEKATNSLLYSMYMVSQVQRGNWDMVSKEGKVFAEEQSAIQEFAKQGSAVFIGHCASEALSDYRDVVRVYLHADADAKRERIGSDYGIPEREIGAAERKNNRRRASYYLANTQKKWEDFRNYDVVLDSSRLGIERCVAILSGIMQ